MKVIDAHAHIFSKIDGEKRGLKTSSAKFGRVNYNNEELVFLPPIFKETAFTAEMLIETMDFAGVSKAVLLQNPVIGIINDEIKAAIQKYPDRFAGTIQVDPMSASACNIISHYASDKQNTLKLEISEEWGWSGKYPGFSLAGKEMMKVWESVNTHNLRVIIDTGDMFNNGYQTDNIRSIATKFPDTKILIEHLGFLKAEFRNNETALKRRRELLQLGKEHHNVFFGFSSAAAFLDDEYPCANTLKLLQNAIEIMGAGKILWGSDIPSTLKKYTYNQMVNVIVKHANFLSESEKHAIMYGNAEAFFFNAN